MKIGPLTAKRMFDLLLELKQEVEELRKDLGPKRTIRKKSKGEIVLEELIKGDD